VARRAAKIKAVRANAKDTVLLFDAGGALFGQSLARASEGRVIIDAMNLLGYDAMVVGRADLSMGMELFLARVAEARFPILACNLVGKDGKLLLPPYTILERNGVRYGILGVTDLETGNAPGVVQWADVLDPVESVRKRLPELQEQSDVTIVLSRLGLEADRSLAQAVPGISVIVGGKSRSLMETPDILDQTVIVQAGYDGEWIGRLDVSLDSEARLCESTLSTFALGPDVASDPELAAFVDSYYKRYPDVPRPAQ
jgi:2',3'-cyclic-nucleotide 2'-phosphodiesterase (5'-nucleotidase family)